METILFFILKIKGVTESKWGESIAIYANPIMGTKLGIHTSLSYIPSKKNDTKTFFFPNKNNIIQPLIRLARSQQIWKPDMNDFEKETVFDENENAHKLIFRHNSFFIDNFDSVIGDVNPVSIPKMKFYLLEQNYTQYMRANYQFDPIDIQVYVSHLAEND